MCVAKGIKIRGKKWSVLGGIGGSQKNSLCSHSCKKTYFKKFIRKNIEFLVIQNRVKYAKWVRIKNMHLSVIQFIKYTHNMITYKYIKKSLHPAGMSKSIG